MLVYQLGRFLKLPDAVVDALPVGPSGQLLELVRFVLGSSHFREDVHEMAFALSVDVPVLHCVVSCAIIASVGSRSIITAAAF